VSLVAAHVRYSGSSIASFPSLKALQAWLSKETSAILPKMLQTFPSTTFSQLLGNATTSIALTEAGEVFTWTQDPRYPKLLGRVADADTPANVPHQIQYLSETNIIQIASGGYLTAALSSDGELFLWGQNCPGTTGCLKVLQQSDEDDVDKFVKCVEITINDKEAKVTHVAIGSGHVIVAAETAGRGGRMERAAFVMGQGESGQLGIGRTPELVEEFTEVPGLKGKKVVQMRASGWNCWIVTEYKH
jgi:alpha-tubulin suppressor-like RCC1 family protein